jgi:UDP-glucose 4-epimerase
MSESALGTHLITGGAGFIGVNLARRLLELGRSVVLVDDLSLGREANFSWLGHQSGVRFAKVDCADPAALHNAIDALNACPIEDVWHLAANSDIAAGSEDMRVDLHRTLLSTTGVLLMLKELGAARIHFASSSAVYGDRRDIEVSESTGPFEPISYYGAMKLASEAQLRAAVEAFIPSANIYRFANIVGAPATHGVILDFVDRLTYAPDQLVVRGNGTQRKPYLHVSELIDAMLFIADHAHDRFNVFNIGPGDEGMTVARIADIVVDAVSPGAVVTFGTERRGWVGDVPRFRFSTAKLKRLGWTARLTSEQAIRQAVAEIVAHRSHV